MGTLHALTEIRLGAAPSHRRVEVPLSAGCPHLERAIFDALAAPLALTDDATPLPAPWLELVTRERFDAGGGCASAVGFGGVAIDAEALALWRGSMARRSARSACPLPRASACVS